MRLEVAWNRSDNPAMGPLAASNLSLWSSICIVISRFASGC
jgi:hypothetical protein